MSEPTSHQLSMTVLMTPEMANFSGKVHGGAVLRLTGSLAGFFAVAALAMAVYGLVILAAVASGSWFERGHLRRPGVLSQR